MQNLPPIYSCAAPFGMLGLFGGQNIPPQFTNGITFSASTALTSSSIANGMYGLSSKYHIELSSNLISSLGPFLRKFSHRMLEILNRITRAWPRFLWNADDSVKRSVVMSTCGACSRALMVVLVTTMNPPIPDRILRIVARSVLETYHYFY